jgi:hypothetical protein
MIGERTSASLRRRAALELTQGRLSISGRQLQRARTKHGQVVGSHGMVYRYRVVPFDYTVPKMIAVPNMTTFLAGTFRSGVIPSSMASCAD